MEKDLTICKLCLESANMHKVIKFGVPYWDVIRLCRNSGDQASQMMFYTPMSNFELLKYYAYYAKD